MPRGTKTIKSREERKIQLKQELEAIEKEEEMEKFISSIKQFSSDNNVSLPELLEFLEKNYKK